MYLCCMYVLFLFLYLCISIVFNKGPLEMFSGTLPMTKRGYDAGCGVWTMFSCKHDHDDGGDCNDDDDDSVIDEDEDDDDDDEL